MGRKVHTEDAEIKTVSVEIKTVTVSKRQMTLSVFRQIELEDLLDTELRKLNGIPWGRVNYYPSGEREEANGRNHVLWQKGSELRRCYVDTLSLHNRCLMVINGETIYGKGEDHPLIRTYKKFWQHRDAVVYGEYEILFMAMCLENPSELKSEGNSKVSIGSVVRNVRRESNYKYEMKCIDYKFIRRIKDGLLDEAASLIQDKMQDANLLSEIDVASVTARIDEEMVVRDAALSALEASKAWYNETYDTIASLDQLFIAT